MTLSTDARAVLRLIYMGQQAFGRVPPELDEYVGRLGGYTYLRSGVAVEVRTLLNGEKKS